MIDLDPITIELCCPRCGFFSDVTIKEIRLGGIIVCRGCKGNLRLVDYMGEVNKARKVFLKSISKLTEMLSKPINLRI